MPRLALAFALLLAAVSLGATSWRLGDWVVDDAFIVFRYAVNWVGGHGPVYNPGEWVEGYSSPVWLALIAGSHAAGVDPVHAARVWGTASVVGALVLLAFDRDPRRAALAVLLAGTSGSLLAWAEGGLETTLAAAVALAAWVGHREARPWAPVVAALAPLVRPELALVPALQLADHLLAGRRRAAATLGLTCLALVGGHALLRWWAYADWVPNPAHAKIGATSEQVLRGLGHLRRWAPWGGPLVVAALVALRDRATAAPVAWVALHVAFVVAVGGDALPAWRFFVPLVPTAAWLAASSVRSRPGELALVGVVAWQPCDQELYFAFRDQDPYDFGQQSQRYELPCTNPHSAREMLREVREVELGDHRIDFRLANDASRVENVSEIVCPSERDAIRDAYRLLVVNRDLILWTIRRFQTCLSRSPTDCQVEQDRMSDVMRYWVNPDGFEIRVVASEDHPDVAASSQGGPFHREPGRRQHVHVQSGQHGTKDADRLQRDEEQSLKCGPPLGGRGVRSCWRERRIQAVGRAGHARHGPASRAVSLYGVARPPDLCPAHL
jgi:hypothetical protein